jgi:hypothetical protein
MAGERRSRDPGLLDALDALPRTEFSGSVWRVGREERNPLQPAMISGRLDIGDRDVLYTSLEPDGEIAVVEFHLSGHGPKGHPWIDENIRVVARDVEITWCYSSPYLSVTREPGEPWIVATSTYVRLIILRLLDDIVAAREDARWTGSLSVAPDLMFIRTPSSHAYERRTNRRRQVTATFGTTTSALLALQDWLERHRVTTIGMESTGVYWKPVYYLLEDTFDCWLLIITRDTCTMCRAARPMSPTPRGLHSSSNMAWCAQASFHRGNSRTTQLYALS